MVPNEAIKRYRELPPNARLLYDCLCMYRNHRTGKCFPSIESLMADSGLSRSALYQARQTLQAAGWVEFKGTHATLKIGFTASNESKQESRNPGQQNPGIPDGIVREIRTYM